MANKGLCTVVVQKASGAGFGCLRSKGAAEGTECIYMVHIISTGGRIGAVLKACRLCLCSSLFTITAPHVQTNATNEML